MEDAFSKCKQILEKYSQEHLLAFYDELDDSKKELLINQILQIDFEEIHNLYVNSFNDDYNEKSVISPLPYIDKSKLSETERDYYNHLGTDSIKNR